MIKVMSILGTRPEGIKLSPIIKVLQNTPQIQHTFCSTGQHKEMLDQVLEVFGLTPDVTLDIFKPGQGLSEVTTKALMGLEGVLKTVRPDLVLVQGDTTTVFAGALAAFYQGIDVGHVEAGLRSFNLKSPFPEEANRKLTGVLSRFHFAATEQSRANLIAEGVTPKRIYIVGNSVIDAVKMVAKKPYSFQNKALLQLDFEKQKVILLTCHRRENWGAPMGNIFEAIYQVVEKEPEAFVIFPMHLNPEVRKMARQHLEGHERILLTEPLDYESLVQVERRCHFIMTDSGGLQEEGPAFGKPVLVLREETERPEGIAAGTAKLTGIEKEAIIRDMTLLLRDDEAYKKMAKAVSPYGDGHTSERIRDIILKAYQA